MPSNFSMLVIYMRFGLANLILFGLIGLFSLTLVLLPRAHPSRIYLSGRLRMARKAMKVALSHEAAGAATLSEIGTAPVPSHPRRSYLRR